MKGHVHGSRERDLLEKGPPPRPAPSSEGHDDDGQDLEEENDWSKAAGEEDGGKEENPGELGQQPSVYGGKQGSAEGGG